MLYDSLVALLLAVSQTTATIFIGITRIVALDGYYAVVRHGSQASFYNTDGTLLTFVPAVEEVAVGKDAFWYVDTAPSRHLCRLAKIRDAQADCVALPSNDAQMSELHYGSGSIYFFEQTVRPVANVPHAEGWDLYRLSEREHSKVLIEGSPVLSHFAPNWCEGPYLEYSFTHNEEQYFGGVVSAKLPVAAPADLPVSWCASNGARVASVEVTKLFVDSDDTEQIATGPIYAFMGGWLVSEGAEFRIYTLNGNRLVAHGEKPGEFGLMFDGARFYLWQLAGRGVY
jgi:hypothetical protein